MNDGASGGVSGGTSGGISGGVSGGMSGGMTGGTIGGVSGGTIGGVSGGRPSVHAARAPKPLWNPYVAGFALGLVLLASFLVMGQGLGASGGITRLLARGLHAVAPGWTESSPHFGALFAGGENPVRHFLVFLGLGVLLGGYLGAFTGRRIEVILERGPRSPVRQRMALALLGGAVMGIAARIAHGCTSGQALSGGATLAAGSWAFMMMVFAGGYAFAALVRRQWR